MNMKIFVSHSRHDDDVLKIVENEIKSNAHEVYFAERHITGKRMEEKLATSISDSNFVLVLWTRNVAIRPETRDMVIWEIVLGRQFNKGIIALVDEKVDASPVIEQVTTYHEVNFADQSHIETEVKQFISENLRSDDEVYREFYRLLNKYRSVEKATEEIRQKYSYTEERWAELISKYEKR